MHHALDLNGLVWLFWLNGKCTDQLGASVARGYAGPDIGFAFPDYPRPAEVGAGLPPGIDQRAWLGLSETERTYGAWVE